jgi:hypothetical protein
MLIKGNACASGTTKKDLKRPLIDRNLLPKPINEQRFI